uniref:Glycosyltransferase n=1 Tax=Dictyoglomus turgidum TaxID=513050 RepID=A0A7C3WWW0_9BACT
MNLSIIIPVYNQLFYTKQVVESIRRVFSQSTKINKLFLVIVDNNSTDETLQYLKSKEYLKESPNFFPYFIHSDENLGYGGGANLGIKYILSLKEDCDFLIMNNDMILLDGCIDNLVTAAYLSNDIGSVGGKLLFPDGTIQHAGAFLNVFGWGQHIDAGLPTSFINQITEVEYVTGALFYIKKEVVDKVGIFDNIFERGYFEEVDYVYRARKEGYKTVYTPFAQAIHYENVTSRDIVKGDSEDVKKQISDKNQIKFYLKREQEEYKSDNPYKVLISSEIYGEWSFCGVMRNLAKGLKRNGVDVSIAPVEYHYDKKNMIDWEIKEMILKPNDYWNRVVLRSSEGDHMYLMPPGKQRIAHTTGESTRVPKQWVEQLNNVDKVFTTSTFFRNVLLECGVKTPIFVLPNSVDTSLFKKEGSRLNIDGLKGLNFVSVFHFGERKAPEILVKAFCNAFTKNDDVTLTIHALSMKFVLEQKGMSIVDWINSIVPFENRPSILVTTNYISDKLMPNFLRNFDVFVLPTRAEGFGLPFIEAGALGIPSIATGYSGLLDYVGEENGWLIDYKLVDIPLQYLPYFHNYIGGQWAEPSVDHLTEIFRHLYNNREEIKKKGEIAYIKAQQYSIENIGKLGKNLIFDK